MSKQNNISPNKTMRQVGLIIYMLGLLAGLLLASVAVWGDLEASQFDPLNRADQRLNSFSCPIVITRGEEAAVSATFRNSGDRNENLRIRTRVTDGFISVIREDLTETSIPPGESQQFSWEVTAQDAAWERIILVRTSTVRNAPYRRLVGSACGILLLPVSGITGQQVVFATLTVSIILLIVGGWLWGLARTDLSATEKRSRKILLGFAGLIMLGVIFGFLSIWGLGLVTIITFLILLGGTIEQYARL